MSICKPYSTLEDQNVLLREDDINFDNISSDIDENNDTVLQLNAGVTIAQNATLYIQKCHIPESVYPLLNP
jgi:hypothetical protein